ncbi:MAG: DNA helicase PriA [Leeuwenhoekiella sp.]
MTETKIQQSELKRACRNCGAELTYKPGTTLVKCDYCDYEEKIEINGKQFQELELKPYLQELGNQAYSEKVLMLHCKNCGANQHVEENYKSLHCVYCSMPLIREDARQEEWILPGAVLPFQLNQRKSHEIFKRWVTNLWFAPNKLRKAAIDPQFTKGLYVPYWTFDAQLHAKYSGERGDYYYVNESYRDSKGKRRTRQVRKTRWRRVAGSVQGFVDDTLINATHQKTGRIPTKIAQWDLQKLKPFHSKFLAGFVTEKYTIPLADGHLMAQDECKKVADTWARRDIGGDQQQVHQLHTALSEETFKHVLLPVYVSAYRYNGKDYRFFINGDSGEISGDRPYSFWKIFFTVLAGLILVAVIVYFSR